MSNQPGDEVDPKRDSEIYAQFRGGRSYTQLADTYQTTRNAIAGIVYRFKRTVYDIDPLPLKALHLTGDYIVAGDVHVPCTDWEWARRVVIVAQRLGINQMILGGDIFNMDAFSIYAHSIPAAEWAVERDAARALLGDWLDWFEKIYILMGNHDRRMEKWTGGNLDEKDIFGMVLQTPQIETTQYSWCTLISGGVPWRISHPKNYGRNQLTVASDLANKYQTNIISFHEHHLSKGYDVYGRWVIVNGGCLVDPRKLAYVALEDTRSAGMVNGFAAVKGGCVSVYGDAPFSEWTCP